MFTILFTYVVMEGGRVYARPSDIRNITEVRYFWEEAVAEGEEGVCRVQSATSKIFYDSRLVFED